MPFDEIDKRLGLAVALVGTSAIITQTILVREFLSIFAGNELIIGIVLANWMILTGFGSFLGRYTEKVKDRTRLAMFLLILLSILPVVTVFLLNILRNVVIPVGSVIGVVESLYYSCIMLAPYCIISGSLFTMFAVMFSERSRSNRISEVYLLEAIGSVFGGLVFNLILIFVFSTFQSLLLLALFNLSICLALCLKYASRTMQILTMTTIAVLVLVVVRVDLDGVARRSLFQNQQLVVHKDTPYGTLAVTRLANQDNFFENSTLLFATNDVTANEDAVHFAMVQHPNPRNVLLISGGISGTIDEILKYGVDRVDYIEINPWIIEIGRRYTSSLDDARVKIHNDDCRRFLRNTTIVYDVVMINVPDPSTAQLNRYYTAEFFQQLRASMSQTGIVALGLLPSDDYEGTQARKLSSVIYNTLQASFRNVIVLQGLRNHFLASDADLTAGIAESIKQHGIRNDYVNGYYIDDRLLAQRSETFVRALERKTSLNKDFTPVAYYLQLQYWLSYFGVASWIPGAIAVLVFLAIARKLNVASLGMFAGGFAASSIEVVLLLSFQIIYGYVYQATGIIISLFMGGLALGSYFGRKSSSFASPSKFIRIQFGIGLYAIFLPFVLFASRNLAGNDLLVYSLFAILTLIIGAMIGYEFSLATRLLQERIAGVASTLYGVDLVGSAIGALLISIYLVPLLGIMQSCFIVGLLNFATAIVTVIATMRGFILIKGGTSRV